MGRISKEKFNEENPFMQQAVEVIEKNIVKKYKGSFGNERAIHKMIDIDTKELIMTSFVRKIEIDEDKFAKFYVNEFKTFFNLSSAGVRVLGYIISILKPSRDFFIMNYENALKYTGYKAEKTIYQGLSSVEKAGIIARGPTDNMWFINPMVLFNGNRITFAKQYVLKKNDLRQEYVEDLKEQIKERYDPKAGITPPQLN